MNILQFTKFYAPVTGGIETVVLELTQGLSRLGVKVDVLCAGTERRTRHDRTAEGGTITRAGSLGTFLSTSVSPALVTQARRMAAGYDVIHVHMPDPMAAPGALKMATVSSRPPWTCRTWPSPTAAATDISIPVNPRTSD